MAVSPISEEPTTAAGFLNQRRRRRTELGKLPGDANIAPEMLAREAASKKPKSAVATAGSTGLRTAAALEPAKLPRTAAASSTVGSDLSDLEGCITDENMAQHVSELDDVMAGNLERKHPNGTPYYTLFGNKKFHVDAVEDESGNLTTLMECKLPYPAEIFWRVLSDFDYCLEYDDYCKKKSIVATAAGPAGNNEVAHFECKFPAPLTNRDWVFYRRHQKDAAAGAYYYVHKDVPEHLHARVGAPPYKGVIRAGKGDAWTLGMVKRIDAMHCQAVIWGQDNYCGNIPKWAINFATKKGLPGFFKGLETAAVKLMVKEGLMTAQQYKTWKKGYSASI